MVVVDLNFLSSNVNPSMSNDVFKSHAIELSEFLVEFSIRKKAFLEGVNNYLLIVERDGYILTIEVTNVIPTALVDLITLKLYAIIVYS